MQTGSQVNIITASSGKNTLVHTHTNNLKSVSRSHLLLPLDLLSVTVWYRVYKGNCVTTVTHYK